MAESSLSLGYADFRREVAHYLGYGRTESAWSDDTSDRLDQIVNSGLRQFYHPPPIGGRIREWSFLKPTTTLAIVGGTGDYTLPDNFGGIDGNITFGVNDAVAPIKIVPEQRIRELRMSDVSGRPAYAAVRPKTSDGTTGQRFEILFFPEPDGSYTLSYKMKALQSALSTTNPYPLGGEAHAETIMASCLAVAELKENDAPGPWQAEWQKRLLASVQSDQQASTPEFFGYIGDPGSGDMLASRCLTVTVNGVPY